MSFREKSAWLVIGILTVVTGWYVAAIATRVGAGAVADVGYEGLVVGAAMAVTVSVAVAHIVLAGVDRVRSDRTGTERTTGLGHRIGRIVLASGAVVAVGLAMTEADHFWIANTLLAGLVVSEVTTSAAEIITQRREA